MIKTNHKSYNLIIQLTAQIKPKKKIKSQLMIKMEPTTIKKKRQKIQMLLNKMNKKKMKIKINKMMEMMTFLKQLKYKKMQQLVKWPTN